MWASLRWGASRIDWRPDSTAATTSCGDVVLRPAPSCASSPDTVLSCTAMEALTAPVGTSAGSVRIDPHHSRAALLTRSPPVTRLSPRNRDRGQPGQEAHRMPQEGGCSARGRAYGPGEDTRAAWSAY